MNDDTKQLIKIATIVLCIMIVTLLSIIFATKGGHYTKLANKVIKENIKPEKAAEIIKNGYKVCIDPGHGGPVPEDAPDFQEVEKKDCLELALLVLQNLEKAGVEVILTREDDVEVTLEERCNIANNANADLFVSIHRNISDIEGVGQGVEVWLSANGTEIDEILGNNVHEKLKEAHIQKTRGIKYGSMTSQNFDYYVNKNTNMPSCLIEMGFLTDEKDNYLFKTYLKEYAKKISEGIIETLKVIDNKKVDIESSENGQI